MFESISNFFGNVKTFFVDAYDTVVDKVSTVYHGVVDTGKEVVGTIHQDIRDYVQGVGNITNSAINKGADTIVHAEDTIGDIGKSFSWPLTIGAAAIAGIYLLKK